MNIIKNQIQSDIEILVKDMEAGISLKDIEKDINRIMKKAKEVGLENETIEEIDKKIYAY